jgi:hypothetical protein
MPPRTRSLALLLVLVAVGLTACGAASSKSVGELLDATFGGANGIKSGRIDAALNFTLAGIAGFDQPVAVRVTGPFEGRGKGKMPKFDLAMSFRQAGQGVAAGVISTGSKGYLRLGPQAFEIPDAGFAQLEQGFLRSGKGKQNPTLKALGIDPRRWLAGAREAGEVTIGGAKTVHITAGIAVDRFLGDINTLLARAGDLGITGAAKTPSLTPAQRAQIARSVRTARVDVYTGADDAILRRLVLAVDLSVPQSARRAVGGLRAGKIALDLRFSRVNEKQDVQAPVGARPLANLNGGAAPSPAAPTAYMSCVQAAGADVAQVQKCAALLR